MERVHGTHKASKSASEEDVISRMPENVITHILDRLPIQDAVRTSILSTNWRFNWNTLTQLVFDEKFFELGSACKSNQNERNLGRILLQLKSSITKFVIFIPNYKMMDVEDISLWVLFLSRKGVKEFTLINMHETPLKLPTHLFSCLELKLLKLQNCCFHLVPSFRGFPNLLNLDMHIIIFESGNCGELITRCPLLEVLRISYSDPTGKVKPVEISKLKNLKMLSLQLRNLENIEITRLSIFQLVGYLPKLEELYLDFHSCKFVAEACARKQVLTVFPCLKTLTLHPIELGSSLMLSFAFKMVWGSPNLHSLTIKATKIYAVPPPALGPLEVNYNTLRKLQLQTVAFENFGGSANEVCFIKYLLACSPMLKKIRIRASPSKLLGGDGGKLMFATMLLKLHRASPIAEVDLFWC